MDKQAILAALYAFVHQRPGLEYGNYGNGPAYRAEMRSIIRDLHHARTLLRALELRQSITASDILAACKGAFSGRLSIVQNDAGAVVVDYCTGQYWPTEYRKAVSAVCASVLWAWTRDGMPAPTLHHNSETGEMVKRYDGQRAGDYLRASLKREFGRGLAAQWFQ